MVQSNEPWPFTRLWGEESDGVQRYLAGVSPYNRSQSQLVIQVLDCFTFIAGMIVVPWFKAWLYVFAGKFATRLDFRTALLQAMLQSLVLGYAAKKKVCKHALLLTTGLKVAICIDQISELQNGYYSP